MRRILSVLLATTILFSSAAVASADEIKVIQVDGVPVSITYVGWENRSFLSPRNKDTVMLKDGSRGEIWAFEAKPGQCVEITMSSSEFDPYLVLRGGRPFGDVLDEDDNSGGGTTAQTRGTFRNGGTYYITATSSGRGEVSGRYQLNIRAC